MRPQPAKVQALARWQEAEPGTWGIAVLVRPDLASSRRGSSRCASCGPTGCAGRRWWWTCTVAGRPLSVVGTHMPHLPYGSHRTWAELRRLLRTEARPDAVLSGDMNTWGPLVRFFLPGWHRAVRGRTWPAWSPHSQIDHILRRGALRTVSGEVLPDAGSDHRPIRTTLELT